MHKQLLLNARAEALFAAPVSVHDRPSRPVLDQLIASAVRRHEGVRGCACEVATAYGERPETAAARMRWARAVVESAYSHD